MKTIIYSAVALAISLFAASSLEAATCTGSASCRACKTCNYCAHCKAGGSCGVCSRRSPETPKPINAAKDGKKQTARN
jgi:hypothetical protein